MIVVDTSAFVSLASVDLADTLLTEFDVHTTELVVDELANTSEYDDRHGDAATTVVENLDKISTHTIQDSFTSSRVDQGEGGCAVLTTEIDAVFLITDDLQALPELQTVANATVAISPIVLKALVQRDVLEQGEAVGKLDTLAEQRDWLGTPIYKRAQNLLE